MWGVIWGKYDKTANMLRAVCLNHRSMVNNMKNIGDRVLLINKDVICYPLPLLQYSLLFLPLLQCSLLMKGLLFWYDSILGYMTSATHPAASYSPPNAPTRRHPFTPCSRTSARHYMACRQCSPRSWNCSLVGLVPVSVPSLCINPSQDPHYCQATKSTHTTKNQLTTSESL